MQVLLTMPFGSRLYGTFDENSDWDYKKMVLPPLEDLLIGTSIKNKFFSSSDDSVKNTSEDTDTELIPIQTFARDVLEGQTYALEMLYAIMQHELVPGVIVHDDRLIDFCVQLERKFLTSNINAMVGYAHHQAQLYSDKGDRLDKLHQFKHYLEFLMNGLLTPDSKLVNAITYCEQMKEQEPLTLDEMLYITNTQGQHGVTERCFSLLEKQYPENITMAEALQRVETTISKYGRRANQAMENKGKDWKAISHALRVTMEAADVLRDQFILLPFTKERANLLREIKYGNVLWEGVQTMLMAQLDEVTELQKTSTLRPKTPELLEEFQMWLKQQMMTFYGINKENV